MKHYDVFLSILPFREYLKPEAEMTLYSQMRILYIYKNFFPEEAQAYLDSKTDNLFKTVFTRFCANTELTSDVFVNKTVYTSGHSEMELSNNVIDPLTRRYTSGSSQAELLSSMVIDEITKYAEIRNESILDLTAGGAWHVYKTAALSYFTELCSDIQMTLTQHLFPNRSDMELSSSKTELAQHLLHQFSSVFQLLTEPAKIQNTTNTRIAGETTLTDEPIRNIHSKTNAKGSAVSLLKSKHLPRPSIHSFFKGSSSATLVPQMELIYRKARLLCDMDPFTLDAFDEALLPDLYSIDRKD